jgi:tRNA nucleotidyltransferase (CCA-adding enzyme)
MSWRREVLKQIKPSVKEEKALKKAAKKVMSYVKIRNTKLEIGGSSAKGTWLKGSHDIDIYVKFDPKHYKNKDLSKILEQSLEPRDFEILHGSRDYFQMQVDGYEIELIPIMDIKNVEKSYNITDISPFHKKWVRKHKHLVTEIRLTKAFCKANKLYGAESYIKGFSGYAIECLTIHFGGFIPLLKKVSQWKKQTIIDHKYYHKGKIKLNPSKMQSPLILIDPVQASRNVTAVVSKERYDLFRKLAKQFLKKPGSNWFVKDEFSLAKLKRTRSKLVWVKVDPLDGKKDVVGAKILKVYDYLRKNLLEKDFDILDSGWHWDDNTIIWFKLSKEPLSKTLKHFGPEIKHKTRLEAFKKKWSGKDIHVENNISYIIKSREYLDAKELVMDLSKEDYIQSRVNKVIEIKQNK